MIQTRNRKVIYRSKFINLDETSNLIYCHFLVNGKTLSNMFYWRVDFGPLFSGDLNLRNIGFHHRFDDDFDYDDIKHYTQVYANKKVFHVYAMQDALKIEYGNKNDELKIRFITIDEELLSKEENNQEKSEKYLI